MPFVRVQLVSFFSGSYLFLFLQVCKKAVVIAEIVTKTQHKVTKSHKNPTYSHPKKAEGTRRMWRWRRRLASASDDYTIKIWNTINGKLVKTLTGHTGDVCSLVVLADGRLASGSHDETIRLWNTNWSTDFLIRNSYWFSSLAVLSDGLLASGSYDNCKDTINLWNTTTGELCKTLTGHTACVRMLVLLQDGRTLASSSDDKTINLWNTTTGELCKTLAGHTGYVWALAVLPDGRLASGSADKTIKMSNTTTGDVCTTLIGHGGWIQSLVVLKDGMLASSDDTTIKLWNMTTGIMFKTLRGHTDDIETLAVLEDGTLVSGSDDRTIRQWYTGDYPEYYNAPDDGKCCSICLEPLILKTTEKLRCGHIFHSECVGDWLDISINNDCPLCRVSL